ncbi:MAG: hypothetical protein ACYCYF_00205, partial [Anaerolineae bacterium]
MPRFARRAGIALGILLLPLLLAACHDNTPRVVVYCSRDQLYAEPVLQAFEQESGIRVEAIYDTGATKTVGLVNR